MHIVLMDLGVVQSLALDAVQSLAIETVLAAESADGGTDTNASTILDEVARLLRSTPFSMTSTCQAYSLLRRRFEGQASDGNRMAVFAVRTLLVLWRFSDWDQGPVHVHSIKNSF